MKTPEFGTAFTIAARTASGKAPFGTHTSRLEADALSMISAYATDGRSFLVQGDVVNAIAAFSYGLGWLDAAFRLGLLAGTSIPLPVLEPDEFRDTGAALVEKTRRYRRLLASANESLDIGPDPGSALYRAAEEFLEQAHTALSDGTHLLDRSDWCNALARFSYGFGWLDAGVRMGLFRIRENREIFTV
jgi:hypothetical protein